MQGIGEGLVSGDITGDEWLFSRAEPHRLIKVAASSLRVCSLDSLLLLAKRTLGSKLAQYIFNAGTVSAACRGARTR